MFADVAELEWLRKDFVIFIKYHYQPFHLHSIIICYYVSIFSSLAAAIDIIINPVYAFSLEQDFY